MKNLFIEQPGVMAHVNYYRQFHEQGKLAMDGSFLVEDHGAMMVPIADLSREEVEAFAAADPAVLLGLLAHEVIPWHTPFEKE